MPGGGIGARDDDAQRKVGASTRVARRVATRKVPGARHRGTDTARARMIVVGSNVLAYLYVQREAESLLAGAEFEVDSLTVLELVRSIPGPRSCSHRWLTNQGNRRAAAATQCRHKHCLVGPGSEAARGRDDAARAGAAQGGGGTTRMNLRLGMPAPPWVAPSPLRGEGGDGGEQYAPQPIQAFHPLPSPPPSRGRGSSAPLVGRPC